MGKRDTQVQIRLDDELKRQAQQYADEHGRSLASVIRALLRFWTNPEDPRPLPPGADDETPPRARRKPKE